MVGCTLDNWVLFVLGLFDANHNDATILKDYFNKYEDKINTIHENDENILIDRDFQNVIKFLTDDKKLRVYCFGLG